MQHIQNKIADHRIEKRITGEEEPPRLVTHTRGVNANELKQMRDYKSGKRNHVGNPVTKRAVRIQFVSDIKTFGSSTSEYDTQNNSCGNPQKKVPVVSQPSREPIAERGLKTCVQAILLSLRDFPVLRVIPRLRPQPDGSVTLVGVLFLERCTQG